MQGFKGLRHPQINDHVIIISKDWCASKKGLKDLIVWIITLWFPLTAAIIYFVSRKKTKWLIKFIFNCDHTSVQISYFYSNSLSLPYGKVIWKFHIIKTAETGEKVKWVKYLEHKNNKLSSDSCHRIKSHMPVNGKKWLVLNLAKYAVLVKLWLLKENLQQLIY